MAEIIRITSEALQATIRRLLPSQQGFGDDLMASSVITPIIDLTPTAEGSVIGVNLQTALSFDSQTAFSAAASTVVLANSAGFWRIFGTANVQSRDDGVNSATFQMSDGLSTKNVWQLQTNASSVSQNNFVGFDFVVFLASGESISAIATASAALNGSYRQIANVNGELVNPSGFSPQ